MAPKDMKWGPAPPSLPKGAKVTVLQGDPGKSGPFVLRSMTPGAYGIPPHWHSQDEQLTVISGTFYLGLGDKADAKKARACLPADSTTCPRRRITTRSRRPAPSCR